MTTRIFEHSSHRPNQCFDGCSRGSALLGKGLGGYVETLVRGGDIQYSLETEWIAFLMPSLELWDLWCF